MLTTVEIAELSFEDATFHGFRWEEVNLRVYLEIASTNIVELGFTGQMIRKSNLNGVLM